MKTLFLLTGIAAVLLLTKSNKPEREKQNTSIAIPACTDSVLDAGRTAMMKNKLM